MKTQNTTTGAGNTTAAHHTPGPWMTNADGEIVDRQGRMIAPVIHAHNVPSLAFSRGSGHNIAEDDGGEANARLIAAAPELLDALREIELLAREIKRSNNADAIVCKCMDVIAKAAKPNPIQLTGWTRMA